MPWPNKKNSRQQAESRGRYAEHYVIWYLRFKGYRIVAWRFRSIYGEIDLIACKGNHLIAIEVKYRKTLDAALFALLPTQQLRIQRCLLYYQSLNSKNARSQLRFDVVCVYGIKLIHLKNAWSAPLN